MSASGVGILSPPLFSSNTGHRPSSPLPPHSSQSPPQSAPQSHPQPPPQSPPQPPTQSPSPPPPSISPQFPSFPPSPLYDYSSLPGGKNYFLRLICFLQHGYLFRDDPNIEHVYHSPTIHESESFILRDVKSPGYPESICKVSRLTFVKPGSAEGKSYAEEELSNYESWLMDFMMEVYILYHSSFFWFPYIVTPLKLSFVTNQPQGRKVSPALHLEFAPYGSIAHLQLTTLPLTIKDKLKLCIDAAEGLRHLHRHDVIHGDITDERFLVFDEVDFPERGKYRAKICHFSDARIASVPFPAHHFSFKPLPRWAAPEYLSGSRRHKYQDRADIWSYGLLIWKILLDGTHPYNTMLLPREVILQHKTFHRFMSLDVKRAIDHILETVREVCDDLTSEYEAGLRKLFACTLAYIPKERDLDKALHILECMSSGSLSALASEKCEYLKTAMSCLTPLAMQPDLQVVDLSVIHEKYDPILQSRFFNSLIDFLDEITLTIRQFDIRLKRFEEMQFQTLWMLARCRLMGLGCRASLYSAYDDVAAVRRMQSPLSSYGTAIVTRFAEACDMTARYAGFTSYIYPVAGLGAAQGSVSALKYAVSFPDWMTSPVFRDSWLFWFKKRHGFGDDFELPEAVELRAVKQRFEGNVEAALNIQSSDIGGENTLLHAAAALGYVDTVRYLIETQGHTTINDLNLDGKAPLAVACMEGHLDVALYLLEKGASANPNHRPGVKEEGGPLHWLSNFESDTMAINQLLPLLLNAGAQLEDVYSPSCCSDLFPFSYTRDLWVDGTPLERAIGRNAIQTARALLNASDFNGFDATALRRHLLRAIEIATTVHISDCLDLLLSIIFDKGREEGLYNTKKDVGALWDKPEGEPRYRENLVIRALYATYKLERIVVHGKSFDSAGMATINILDSYGFIKPMIRHRSVYCNLLHVAIKIMPGEGFLFRHLLRNTCLGNFVNTHSQNNQVFYPLGIAIHAHNRDAFLLLVENGAKFSINGERDKTTLGQAQVPHFSAILRYCSWACFEDEHVVRYLVDAGAPFNTLSPEGIAPLQDALLVGSFKLAKMLISLGADINEVIPDDSNGAFSEHVKGYTLMGALLSDYFLYSFRDIVASIRFVLSLPPQYRPKFIVHEQRKETMLHLVVRGDSVARIWETQGLMDVLLQHFSSSEEINALDNYELTALSEAIEQGNPVAVRALLAAGADLRIGYPASGGSAYHVAQHAIMRKEPHLVQDEFKVHCGKGARRSFEVLSIIDTAREWTVEQRNYCKYKFGQTVLPLYRHIKDAFHMLEQESHRPLAKYACLGFIIGNLEDPRWGVKLVPLTTATELHDQHFITLQLYWMLQPWFTAMSIIVFSVKGHKPIISMVGSELRELIPASFISWISTDDDIRGLLLSVLMDYLLMAVHRGTIKSNLIDVLAESSGAPASGEPNPKDENEMEKAAQNPSGDVGDGDENNQKIQRPISALWRTPTPLDLWYSEIEAKCKTDDEEEVLRIRRFARIARKRVQERAKRDTDLDAQDVDASEMAEFEEFHFNTIFGGEVRVEDVEVSLLRQFVPSEPIIKRRDLRKRYIGEHVEE